NDEVEAVVLDIDKVNQRISLGVKQLDSDPWKEIDQKYKIGDLVQGKVTKLASFGAFVQLQDDIDGLVHISQLSEEHVAKVKDILKVGQEVEAASSRWTRQSAESVCRSRLRTTPMMNCAGRPKRSTVCARAKTWLDWNRPSRLRKKNIVQAIGASKADRPNTGCNIPDSDHRFSQTIWINQKSLRI